MPAQLQIVNNFLSYDRWLIQKQIQSFLRIGYKDISCSLINRIIEYLREENGGMRKCYSE